jgi:hypothetical protein
LNAAGNNNLHLGDAIQAECADGWVAGNLHNSSARADGTWTVKAVKRR